LQHSRNSAQTRNRRCLDVIVVSQDLPGRRAQVPGTKDEAVAMLDAYLE